MHHPHRPCHHGVIGGCPYCRSIVIADDGPDLHPTRVNPTQHTKET